MPEPFWEHAIAETRAADVPPKPCCPDRAAAPSVDVFFVLEWGVWSGWFFTVDFQRVRSGRLKNVRFGFEH